LGSATATVPLYAGSAAIYSGLSDANLLTAINTQLQSQGIAYTAALDGTAGFSFTSNSTGAIASDPTSTLAGANVALAKDPAGADAVAAVYNIALTNATVAGLSSPFVISDGTNSVTLKDMSGVSTVAELKQAINSATATPAALQFTVDTDVNGLVLNYKAANAGVVSVTPSANVSEAQVSTLNLSSIFGTIRDGDTITYTVDGKAASAVLSAVQNADGTWSMTGIKSSNNTTGTTAGLVTIGTVTGTDGNPKADQLILTGTNGTAFSVENIQVTRGVGANVGNTDIMTFTTATAALNVLDEAVASVNLKRADLGATTSRLNYASDNMANVSMNARQSRSRVEDADYARETTELARTQIIQQAGTAMLAQANQSAQAVLKLLNT
jgi:flagellin